MSLHNTLFFFAFIPIFLFLVLPGGFLVVDGMEEKALACKRTVNTDDDITEALRALDPHPQEERRKFGRFAIQGRTPWGNPLNYVIDYESGRREIIAATKVFNALRASCQQSSPIAECPPEKTCQDLGCAGSETSDDDLPVSLATPSPVPFASTTSPRHSTATPMSCPRQKGCDELDCPKSSLADVCSTISLFCPDEVEVVVERELREVRRKEAASCKEKTRKCEDDCDTRIKDLEDRSASSCADEVDDLRRERDRNVTAIVAENRRKGRQERRQQKDECEKTKAQAVLEACRYPEVRCAERRATTTADQSNLIFPTATATPIPSSEKDDLATNCATINATCPNLIEDFCPKSENELESSMEKTIADLRRNAEDVDVRLRLLEARHEECLANLTRLVEDGLARGGEGSAADCHRLDEENCPGIRARLCVEEESAADRIDRALSKLLADVTKISEQSGRSPVRSIVRNCSEVLKEDVLQLTKAGLGEMLGNRSERFLRRAAAEAGEGLADLGPEAAELVKIIVSALSATEALCLLMVLGLSIYAAKLRRENGRLACEIVRMTRIVNDRQTVPTVVVAAHNSLKETLRELTDMAMAGRVTLPTRTRSMNSVSPTLHLPTQSPFSQNQNFFDMMANRPFAVNAVNSTSPFPSQAAENTTLVSYNAAGDSASIARATLGDEFDPRALERGREMAELNAEEQNKTAGASGFGDDFAPGAK